MKESLKPVSREMWYKAQKHQAEVIKRLEEKIMKLADLVEELIQIYGRQ